MRPTIAAPALALLCACVGNTKGQVLLSDSGVGPPIGAGDAGNHDGGDAGQDAGSDAGSDAGCTALSLSGVPAVDGCFGNAPTTATGTVNTVNCSIDISLGTSTGPCRGTVSGTLDAFDGGCQGGFYTCTSPSLPGTLNCIYGTTICSIKICDAGTACP